MPPLQMPMVPPPGKQLRVDGPHVAVPPVGASLDVPKIVLPTGHAKPYSGSRVIRPPPGIVPPPAVPPKYQAKAIQTIEAARKDLRFIVCD